ncbi:Protease 7 [Enterobacter sp. FY-07]|uniref:omptin family outer membrane protease n=1 Tax=Kosakonia oryzendophytica TaxID=1005665 RepID=UPI000777ED65|nr:omptin family outer membrane protease [Kosakonia oryzendophytica]AMO49252.1 Protease 7 [Enterobacter sp. FY-07]WBT56287.1 omptin family outer membrane protease [Kosakonia oryzendophytica]
MHKLNIILALFFIPMAFPASAEMQNRVFNWDRVSAGINVGTLSGLTHERVYSPNQGGRKLSQLDWRYRNAAVVQGALEWDAMRWFSLGASGWSTFSSGNSHMNDYDWQNAVQDSWTDHSSHPDTRLNFSNQFDVNVKGWMFNTPGWRLGVMVGYQENRISFHSRGGSYSYNNGAHTGSFDPNEINIGYKQHYQIPYVGLTGRYRYSDIEFSGTLKYSAWARTTGNDEHYLRDLTFTDKAREQNFFSLAASVGYYVTENMKLYIEGTWNRVTNKKTDVNVNNYRQNINADYKNGGGIESYNMLTTAGLVYTF